MYRILMVLVLGLISATWATTQTVHTDYDYVPRPSLIDSNNPPMPPYIPPNYETTFHVRERTQYPDNIVYRFKPDRDNNLKQRVRYRPPQPAFYRKIGH